MLKYTQDFLPNFLDAEAEARESMITETERQVYLARQFCRYDKMLKVCKNEQMRLMLEKAKRDTLTLMQRT